MAGGTRHIILSVAHRILKGASSCCAVLSLMRVVECHCSADVKQWELEHGALSISPLSAAHMIVFKKTRLRMLSLPKSCWPQLRWPRADVVVASLYIR